MPSHTRGFWLGGWVLRALGVWAALLGVSAPAHAVEALASSDPMESSDGADLAPWPGLFEASRIGAGAMDGVGGEIDADDAARGAVGEGTRRRGLWLGVSAGMAVSPGERERVFGLLELGLSLDEWFGAGAALGAMSETRAEAEASGALGSDRDADMDTPGSDTPGNDTPGNDTAEAGAGPAIAGTAGRVPGAGLPATAHTPGTAGAAGARGLTPFALGTGLATPVLARPTFTAVFATPALAAAPASAPLPPAPAIWPADEAPSSTSGTAWAHPPNAARSLDPASAALARATVSEALRIQGGGRELRRLDSMASRSRAAASLPEVRLGAGTSRDESMRLSPTLSDPAHFSRDGGRDLWLEARLTWRLDGAIFARDEIAIMRLRAQQREGAAQLAREVVEALLDWQRARLLLASPLASPEELDAATVRHFGAVARLDVFTDGWFSRQLARWGAATP